MAAGLNFVGGRLKIEQTPESFSSRRLLEAPAAPGEERLDLALL